MQKRIAPCFGHRADPDEGSPAQNVFSVEPGAQRPGAAS